MSVRSDRALAIGFVWLLATLDHETTLRPDGCFDKDRHLLKCVNVIFGLLCYPQDVMYSLVL